MISSREQWLNERSTGITGTGAAAIMGASPYMTNVDYWLEKTGQAQPAVVDNEFVKYGSSAEIHLIELFRLDFPFYDVVHREYDLRRHPDYPWLIGSIDGELSHRDTEQKGILEIKTAKIMSAAHAAQWRDSIPTHYFWQVLHYLLVTGYLFVVLKAQLKYEFVPGEVRLDTRHYFFTREEVQTQIDELLKKELLFWQHVERRERPPLILPRI